MSLTAIQDTLLKTNLVQQTQSKADDVSRSQETAAQQTQKEQSRQEDQVVIHTNQKDGSGIRDEEKQRQRRNQEEEEEEDKENRDDENAEEDEGPRARMRTINIVI